MKNFDGLCPVLEMVLHQSDHAIPLKVGTKGFICDSETPQKYCHHIPIEITIVYIDKVDNKIVFIDNKGNPIKAYYSDLEHAVTSTENPLLVHTLDSIIKSFDKQLKQSLDINFTQFIDKLNISRDTFPEKWL